MKTTILTVLVLLTLVSCYGQEKNSDSINIGAVLYQEIGESTFSIGGNTSILDCKQTSDSNYLLFISTNPLDNIIKNDLFFLKISPKGDSINCLPVSFDYLPTDYIQIDNFYFVVTTEVRTMGGYTQDFLNKYDKSWKLIWSKKLNKPKYPDGHTVLTHTTNNEILLIANEFIPKTNKNGISIRRYNLSGKLISENLMLTKGQSNPISIIKTDSSNYYLTAEQYNQETEINSLWLMKLNQIGDTLWTRKFPKFYSTQTIQTKNGDLIFYGSDYSASEDQDTHYHYLKIIILDKEGKLKLQKEIKQNYYEKPGNVVETKNGNFLFSSTVTPLKDNGDVAYIFETNENGEMIFERKFDYSVGIGSVPYLIRTEGQITMISQKWIGEFGEAFHDIIQLNKLTE